MRIFLCRVVIALACAVAVSMSLAQEKVTFASLDRSASGPPVMLDGYLYVPQHDAPGARYPAVVFMHGCSGLLTRSGKVMSREADWAQRLTSQGYVVLAVDSFTTRAQASECARGGPVRPQVERALDAYGALRFLQRRADVEPDRVALIGWSHGGGTVLFAIASSSPARSEASAPPDFRAAVAFYPGWCNNTAQHGAQWTTSVPLLILAGERDVWTPAAPCETFVRMVRERNVPVELHVYADAYHDFDFPHLPVRSRPEFANPRTGIVPITGTNEAARSDAIERVTQYLAGYLKGPSSLMKR